MRERIYDDMAKAGLKWGMRGTQAHRILPTLRLQPARPDRRI